MNVLEEIVNIEIREIIKKISKKYGLNENEAINYVNGEKRGRPRQGKKLKGPRGRPRMEEKERTSKVGEDLIERLIMKAKRENVV